MARSTAVGRHGRRQSGLLVWLTWGFAVALGLTPQNSIAEPDAGALPALACAVEGARHPHQAAVLCRKLGERLGRRTPHVADARTVRRSPSVQLILQDVQWIVIYLERGKVRAFTRISTVDAERREAQLFARAVRTLARLKPPKEPDACLRVEPARGGRESSFDLAYPWAELKRCRRHVLGVVDPWGP